MSRWLEGKPRNWAYILAIRLALRGLPNAASSAPGWLDVAALFAIRALAMSWAAAIHPSESLDFAVANSSVFVNDDFGFHPEGFAVGRIAALVASSIISKEEKHAVDVTIKVANEVARFEIFRQSMGEVAWGSLRSDCLWLDKRSNSTSSGRLLALQRLWLWRSPQGWREEHNELTKQLFAIDPNYFVWIDWYQRRIRGERAAFYISEDKGHKEDKTILRRLAEAKDEEFWSKGHQYVNAELTRWLDEARERARASEVHALNAQVITLRPPDIGSATLAVDAQLPPPQNRNVLSFKSTPEGRIAIDATAMSERLRNDQDARQRYDEAVSEAKLALDRCLRSNAGARLTRLLENYLAATGEGLDDAKPSLIVQRGERLRQELAGCENPDSFIYPIANDLRNDLMGWRTAHNMMVGLDPVLNAADLAMLGPDRQPALIPPDEIGEKVEKADQAGLIETGDAEIIAEGIALAPASPDINDRRTIWSVEVIRNLFSESMGIALNPLNADAQASGIILISGFRAVCGSIDHAKFIVENRDWILDRLGSTPTWRDLIDGLVERLETITPFDPK